MRCGKKGSSLVELLVSLAILSVIMAPISMVLYSGFNTYYIENDVLMATQRAREEIDAIVEDIRSNDSQYLSIEDDGKTLNIIKNNPDKEDLVYKLSVDDGEKVLLKNDTPVFKPEDKIILLDFNAVQYRQADYDSSIVKVALSLKVGKSDPISIERSYRRKIE
ncbi:MAG: type II secretion system protein [Bacillota bacterium]|nr:type II secretion system protein [Bacillota bacterium]